MQKGKYLKSCISHSLQSLFTIVWHILIDEKVHFFFLLKGVFFQEYTFMSVIWYSV